MNESQTKTFIHYDPVREDYTVSLEELRSIKNAGRNNWKDFAVGCLCIGVPCVINAIVEACQERPFKPTLSFNLNAIVGALGFLLGIAFLVAWGKTKTDCERTIRGIVNKPKMEFTPGGANVGKITPG